MSSPLEESIRAATLDDGPQLLRLWASLFDEDEVAGGEGWRTHAHDWLAQSLGNSDAAHFPVVAIKGEIVATAIGTLELGVPNPHSPRGRTVRLANVITAPAHRRLGYGARLVQNVVDWARSIDADRVDLSATPDGQCLYARAGFLLTKAPRMKLVL